MRKERRAQGARPKENLHEREAVREKKNKIVTEEEKASERADLVQSLLSTSDREDEARCYGKLKEVKRAVKFLENCELLSRQCEIN